MSAIKGKKGEVDSAESLWCSNCPRSDYNPHEYPAHAKTQLPAVPHGKLPPTGRSMAMQSGAGEATVWERADKLLAGREVLEDDRCGFKRFTQKRNRPWNTYLPLTKPMAESVVIEDDLNPLTRWVLSYNWLNRGFYPCCDPNNPAGSGTAKIVRRDGYLYPLDVRSADPCPKDCIYCDTTTRCEKCSPRPPPAGNCQRDRKDKCKKENYDGDKHRAPLYREKNKQM